MYGKFEGEVAMTPSGWVVRASLEQPCGKVTRFVYPVAKWLSAPRACTVEYQRDGLWTAPRTRLLTHIAG